MRELLQGHFAKVSLSVQLIETDLFLCFFLNKFYKIYVKWQMQHEFS